MLAGKQCPARRPPSALAPPRDAGAASRAEAAEEGLAEPCQRSRHDTPWGDFIRGYLWQIHIRPLKIANFLAGSRLIYWRVISTL